MNLGVAGQHVGAHQLASLGHRLCGRFMAPGEGPEMVAPQDERGWRIALLRRDLGDKGPEVGGAHTGVAAELVDLVAGRLDEHDRLVAHALPQGRLEHEAIGRADRGQPDAMPRAV